MFPWSFQALLLSFTALLSYAAFFFFVLASEYLFRFLSIIENCLYSSKVLL